MADEIKNVFISHIHEDDDGLAKVKELLAKNGLQIRDSSINSLKPNEATSAEYIKSGILAPNINWASTLLVYVTPETRNSDWVEWEIEYAQKAEKRIVGVWAHGANECDLPDALDRYADAVVGWNSARIIDAICGKANDWVRPDGTARPDRPIKRYGC